MKIFISGKITGEPIWDCIHKFGAVESLWFFGQDFNVFNGIQELDFINPLEIEGIHFGISHKKAMELCFAELEKCDGIFMLKDWKQSKGAKMEHKKAMELGIKIYYQK